MDEIGDMPLESQTSLLRFLETGHIERLGSTESIAVDVRVVSATHVDLQAAVAAERFRGDLYHRLCVLRVKQPPLRERERDIVLLAEHILNQIRKHSPERIRGFSPAALRSLHAHDWPGNVRELINRIRNAAAMCEDGVIRPCDSNCIRQPRPNGRPPWPRSGMRPNCRHSRKPCSATMNGSSTSPRNSASRVSPCSG